MFRSSSTQWLVRMPADAILRTAAVAGVLSLAASAPHSQGLVHQITGNPGDAFRTVAGAGDVDGDGVPDIIGGSNTKKARVWSGANAKLLLDLEPAPVSNDFGKAVDGAGDVNGDGHADVIVGDMQQLPAGASGYARVFSGADGSVVHHVSEGTPIARFGFSVAGIGDTDDDGFSDFAVGAIRDAQVANDAGSVRLFSGADGSVRFFWGGDGIDDAMGFSLSGAGDVNADGFPDVIAGATESFGFLVGKGYVRVFSGLDGSTLHSWEGASPGEGFGRSVDGAGDVDADGFADLVVGAVDFTLPHGHVSYARVFSGATGAALYTFHGIEPVKDEFGMSVAGVGDANGDGFADVLVGALESGDDDNEGYVQLFSGFDGSVLFTVDGQAPGDAYGLSISGGGDLNGDGIPEFLVGSGSQIGGPLAGLFEARSGGPLTLTKHVADLSLAAGGNQALRVLAPPALGGHLYLVGGSATGIAPGTAFGGELVPLVLDPWTLFTLTEPNGPILQGTFGLLESTGSAVASIVVPPASPPSLAGLTLYHAAVVFSPTGGLDLATNATYLNLVP